MGMPSRPPSAEQVRKFSPHATRRRIHPELAQHTRLGHGREPAAIKLDPPRDRGRSQVRVPVPRLRQPPAGRREPPEERALAVGLRPGEQLGAGVDGEQFAHVLPGAGRDAFQLLDELRMVRGEAETDDVAQREHLIVSEPRRLHQEAAVGHDGHGDFVGASGAEGRPRSPAASSRETWVRMASSPSSAAALSALTTVTGTSVCLLHGSACARRRPRP